MDNAAEIILQMKKDFITSSMRITAVQTSVEENGTKRRERERKKKEKRTMHLIKWNSVDTETKKKKKKSKESRGKWIR